MNDLLALLAAVLVSVGSGGAPPTEATAGSAAAPAAPAWGLKRLPIDVDFPVDMVTPVGEPTRMFIAEQRSGHVLEWNGTTSRVVIDVARKLEITRGEEGLLGVALHPRFARNGRMFIVYSGRNRRGGAHLVTVEEWRYRGPSARATFTRRIIAVQEITGAHNGGNVAFGPDGLLYLSTGDGGMQGDPTRNAQDPRTILGKVLRIDVDRRARGKAYAIPPSNPFARGGGAPEIWALGLRNPWRWSFDRRTGDMWIGDVGLSTVEEVSYLPRTRTARGARGIPNFGWSRFEGKKRFQAHPERVLGRLVPPVFTYRHPVAGETRTTADRGCSIIGGFVYRGAALPALRGRYIAADFCSRAIWVLRRSGSRVVAKERYKFDTENAASSFAQDADGELYLLGSQRGPGKDAIYKLVPAAEADAGVVVPMPY